jgi:hypothetical protein
MKRKDQKLLMPSFKIEQQMCEWEQEILGGTNKKGVYDRLLYKSNMNPHLLNKSLPYC